MHMKKLLILSLLGLSLATLLTGCLSLQVGGGTTSKPQAPTVGQQLIDLKHAKDMGVISDTEYQVQKAKILDEK
jgi:hypothetical protein